MRDELRRLQTILERCGEDAFARMVESVVSGSESAMDAFVVSMELWGGPGSIADQAAYGGEPEGRRQVERALVDLGEAQIRVGMLHERTERWVGHFKQRSSGVS